MTYTVEDIASNYRLWIEYVDPFGVYTYEEFQNMSFKKLVQLVRYAFGDQE